MNSDNNNNKNKKECEGCTINTCIIRPLYIDPETDKTIECPCRNCIVKVMCKGVCMEYVKYVESERTEKYKYDY